MTNDFIVLFIHQFYGKPAMKCLQYTSLINKTEKDILPAVALLQATETTLII